MRAGTAIFPSWRGGVWPRILCQNPLAPRDPPAQPDGRRARPAPPSRAQPAAAQERESVKQAEEASFVDLIACERDCRIVQLCGGARLRRQLRRLPPQRLLPLRQPRRRPEQDGAAAHRAAPDPAPGSPGPELGGRVRHPRPGRADPVDLGASLTSRPRKHASPSSRR